MKTSSTGYDLIKFSEGKKNTAYKCSAGVVTIGYGHTKGVKMGDKITDLQAFDFLVSDVRFVENALNATGCVFTQNEFDALVSLFYNLGTGRITNFLPLLKAGDKKGVAEKINKYVYAGKEKLKGLIQRRQRETNLYLS